MTTEKDTPNETTGSTGDHDEIDPKLLEILVCPLTKGPLEYDRGANELISRKARLAYPIRDGIPIMLPGEARELET
ncbi:MAG TPA: Trm112 family protein [Rhodobacteraceae bacterium]|nr:Trm112 family protein [Paracoccaceae bacterium]